MLILVVSISAFKNKHKKLENKEITNIVKEGNEYVVYDKNGKEITRVSDREKYKTKIYEIAPGYEEIEYPDADIIGGTLE